MTTPTRLFAALAAAVAVLGAASSHATSVTITTPFMNLEHRAINSLGFTPGEFLRIGANSVLPNGLAGTTGIGRTTNLLTSAAVARTINFSPSPIIPNFFSRNLAYDPALLGPWTLTFSNGTDSASTVVSLPAGTTIAPFVNSITLSSTAENPTFTWTPPPGTTVNGYRLNIYDKSLINHDPTKGPINNGQVTSRNVTPDITSYTVSAGDFTVPGYAFTLGTNYSIEISLIQTKDGSSSLGRLGNDNLASIARVYADFTPRTGGGPVVNLPVVLVDGSYKFDMTIEAGKTYYIDPEVAVGYDYAIGDGDANFRSVLLPTDIGDGLYDIFGIGAGGDWELLAHDWAGGAVFNFGVDGVGRFRVAGIETDAGLDPASTTAFITGLTFTADGHFTGTQTPITVTVAEASEPASLALLAAAVAGLGWQQRRRRAS